jgi:N-acetylneuraminic acid mutarotase
LIPPIDWIYFFHTKKWQLLAYNGPQPFSHAFHSSKTAGNTIFIFGGLDINGAQVNYMFELSLEIISLPSIFTPLCSTA